MDRSQLRFKTNHLRGENFKEALMVKETGETINEHIFVYIREQSNYKESVQETMGKSFGDNR